MLLMVCLMAAVWLVGAALGWSAGRRFLLLGLIWAYWLLRLASGAGADPAALRDAVTWALLAPAALGAWAYAGWVRRLRQRAHARGASQVDAARGGAMAAEATPGPGVHGAGPSASGADDNVTSGLNAGAGSTGLSGSDAPRSASDLPEQSAAPADRLSAPELERYSRHILLREVGGPGQMKLRRARVLVIGAGGLGAPVLQYLAAAGVGTLAVIDDDTVDGSNLHRQVIHDEADIGKAKVISAAERLRAQNPHVTVIPLQRRLTEDEAPGLFAGFDLILDGTDNFDTRYLANRAAVAAGKPLLTGALTQWEGQVTLLDPARGGPCYHCLFPVRPAEGLVPACSTAGVIGPMPGVIGALMATEAVKLLTGAGESLRGRLLIWDSLEAEMREIRTRPRSDCPVCGKDHAA